MKTYLGIGRFLDQHRQKWNIFTCVLSSNNLYKKYGISTIFSGFRILKKNKKLSQTRIRKIT